MVRTWSVGVFLWHTHQPTDFSLILSPYPAENYFLSTTEFPCHTPCRQAGSDCSRNGVFLQSHNRPVGYAKQRSSRLCLSGLGGGDRSFWTDTAFFGLGAFGFFQI